MTRFTRLVMLGGLLTTCSIAGFFVRDSAAANPMFPQTTPGPCVCSEVTTLTDPHNTPPAPPIRIGHCQCGVMSCAVSSVGSQVALQCVK